jgi:trimethylamine--corrinoid protein Co-methyltransferase
MKTAGIAIGSPESALFTSIFAQISRWYHLPSRAGGALTDSKVPDVQSGYEKMMVLMSALLSGVNFILHSAGILDSYLTISYEQFVIDLEMIRNLKRFIRGMDISEEKITLKEIKEVGPGGNFLSSFHTSKYFREEFFLPTISERSSYETWELEGSKTMYQRANAKYKQMLEDYQQPKLDPKIQRKLENFVSERKRNNFGDPG